MNLAPNGKPSNLTDEQYKLVRTSKFKKWFGNWETKRFRLNHKPLNDIHKFDTISLDENGEPKIWYRGTYDDYNEFNTKNIYLGSKKSYVKQYGNLVKEFFVFSEKTIFIDNEEIERKHLGITFEYLAEYLNEVNKISLTGDSYKKLKEIFKNQTKNESLAVWEYFTQLGNEEVLNLFKDWFRENGFDCIQYWETGKKNNFGKYPVGLICLYFGDEIKLADGTNTEFDSYEVDIRYAGGGEVDSLNYFDSTTCEFKPIISEDSIEILNQYAKWRRLKIKPQFIYSSKYGNLRIDYESEKKNAFFQSRSLSYYFVSENDDFVIRISDHWSKSNYEKSRKLNCGYIRSVSWTNYGEKFHYRLPAQSYGSDLIGGICYFKDFNKE